MNNAFYNGVFMPLEDVKISPLDRGFLFAESIYEVLLSLNKIPFLLEDHYQRLCNNAKEIEIQQLPTENDFKAIISTLNKNVPYINTSIYFQISKGAANKRSHYINHPLTPTVFATIQSYTPYTITQLRQGFKAITVKDIRWDRCDIKSTSLLGNTLSLEKAKKNNPEIAEIIFIRDNFVQEGSSSCLMMEKNGKIITPPLSPFILPSITRQFVLNYAEQNNIKIEQKPITKSELYSADNLWLLSTTKCLMPISQIDEHPVADGKPSQLWFNLIEPFIKASALKI